MSKPKPNPRKPKALYRTPPPKPVGDDFVHTTPIALAPFQLREDGSIHLNGHVSTVEEIKTPPPKLVHATDSPFLRLYHGNSLELLDAIYEKYGDAGRFDAIFADPPYFLSNGGISCHAGRMVKADKGDWDKSRGPELNHEFNLEWLKRCQRVLKPNGTIWIPA